MAHITQVMVFMYLFQMPNTLNTQWLLCVFSSTYTWKTGSSRSKNILKKNVFLYLESGIFVSHIQIANWMSKSFHFSQRCICTYLFGSTGGTSPSSFLFPSKAEGKQSVLISAALQTWNKIDPRKEWAVGPVPAFDPNLALLNRPGLTEPTQSNSLSVEQSTSSCRCQVKRCLCYSALESRPLAVKLTRAPCVWARPHWRWRRGWLYVYIVVCPSAFMSVVLSFITWKKKILFQTICW